ncbi:MAG: MucB/RseB C-terminal domain-containing protein [Rhodocyclaceae bacterium]|nr:MucB/RseB C-terminal domain-containing protein [Rhodocyclaceae bacterium]
MRRTLACAVALCLAPPLAAQTSQPEAMQWLQRVAVATQKLSFSGTFVYQNGRQSETSRIVRWAGNGRQIEKIEVLDGSPREVIRQDDEVRCYLPENRLVIVEQRSTRRNFPALLPASLAGLREYYHIRLEGAARIAGQESQIVRLDPRDAWRYGHRFWVAREAGLLLRADIWNAAGEPLETIAFTELRLGEPASPELLRPSSGEGKEAWQVRQAKLRELRDDGPWLFGAELPGFRRQAALRRILPGGAEPAEVLHWIFSDGLAAISVFISPAAEANASSETEVRTMGAISVAKRHLAGHRIVVMGDVPPAAVQYFAAGIGMREK